MTIICRESYFSNERIRGKILANTTKSYRKNHEIHDTKYKKKYKNG